MLIRDLLLLAENSRYLPRLLASSTPTNVEFRETFSEIGHLEEQGVTATQLLKGLVSGQGAFNKTGGEVFAVGPYNHPKEVWIFVNGILTDRDMAVRNALALSNIFRRTITVLHNPTHGIIPDLVESTFSRTFDNDCPVTKDLYAEVMGALLDGKKVKVIGHSQGGIIVSRLLNRFKLTEQDMFKKLEVYTFASGADEDVEVKGVYQEHFANSDDFVCRIGMIHVQPKSNLYVRKEVGHLLNRDYLEHFAGGHFCGKLSRLFKYVGGKHG